MAEITVFYEGPIVTRVEARARGIKRYFTGKPCRHGHIAQRLSINWHCIACDAVRAAKYYVKNRLTLLAALAVRRANNPEPFRAADAKYLANNRESRRIACLEYRSNNLAKRRAADAAYYANNREQRLAAVKVYRDKNRGKLRASIQAGVRNYRARKVGARGEFTAGDERKLKERQKKCHICGKRFTKADPATIDHVIALANGGANDPSNIALAHHGCNSGKQARRTHLL